MALAGKKRRMRSSDTAGRRVYMRATEGYIPRPVPQYAVRVQAAVARSAKETGFLDSILEGVPFNTTGLVQQLNMIPQGNTVNTRVGKKILLKSVQIRGSVDVPVVGIANPAFHKCSFLIVYDRRPVGTLPVMTDFFTSSTSTAMNNDANSGRFQILKRHDFMINISNATAGQEQFLDTSSCTVDEFISLKGLQTVYKAAGTGAPNDTEQGALYLVTIGNQSATTIFPAGPVWELRVRFLDV
jgi:Geminivirus coat protein/nuclear export factor BR1 family.